MAYRYFKYVFPEYRPLCVLFFASKPPSAFKSRIHT